MNITSVNSFKEAMRKFNQLVINRWKDDLQCCGVSLAQYRVILQLGRQGSNTSLVDLSQNLELDTSTLSRTVNGLVLEGLIQRVPGPTDRRYIHMGLTPEGQALYRKVESLCNDYYLKVFNHIPEDKHAQVLESIQLLLDAVVECNASFDCNRKETCKEE